MPNEDCSQAPYSWMKRMSQKVYKNNKSDSDEPIKEEQCQCHLKNSEKGEKREEEDNEKTEQYNICFSCFNKKPNCKNLQKPDYQLAAKNTLEARDEIRNRAVLGESDSFDAAEFNFDTVQKEGKERVERQKSYLANSRLEFDNVRRKVTYDLANSARKASEDSTAPSNAENELIDTMLFPGLRRNIRNVATNNNNNNKTVLLTTENTTDNTHRSNDNNKVPPTRKKSQQPSEFIREFLGPADTPVNVRLFGGRKGVQYEIERAKSYGYVIHPCSKLRYV